MKSIDQNNPEANHLRVSPEKILPFIDILDLLDESIFILDTELCFQFINRKMRESAGIKLQNIESMRITDILSSELTDLNEFVKRALDGKPGAPVEVFCISSSNNPCCLEINVRPLYNNESISGVIGMCHDITSRKMLEKHLLENRLLLETTIENLPFDFFAIDRSGKYFIQNSTCRKHWGDIVGKTPEDVDVDPKIKKLWVSNNSRAFNGETVKEEVSVNVHGETRYLLNIIAPIQSGSAVIGILGINLEITEMKRTEDTLRRTLDIMEERVLSRTRDLAELNEALMREIKERERAEDELVKAQKLESIGLLAGGIAHDFNNIMSAITGYLVLLQRRLPAEDPGQFLIKKGEKACGQAQDLTQQLLTFAKGGTPLKETQHIETLIRDAVYFASRGSNVACEFDIAEDLHPVEVDPVQINQVINNLVINGIHAMPGGGILDIKAENIELTKKHSLPLEPGSYIRIAVSDQGTGIPEDNLIRVFDPYYTTKEFGTGLGLAISYSIMLKHQGYISVTSELRRGSTFCLYLPASGEPVRVPESLFSDLVYGSGKILLMDDNEMVLDAVSQMIQELGYEVQQARNGEQTLTLFQTAMESGSPYDLVILDLTVRGGMGGKKTAEKLLKLAPDVKLVASSGYSHNSVLSNFEKYGFSGRIIKPYPLEELSVLLKNIISSQ